MKVTTPWLIQRCLFVMHNDLQGSRFSDLFTCDYMGSAEFEFGALPKSLNEIRLNFPYYHVTVENSIEFEFVSHGKKQTSWLRIWHPFVEMENGHFKNLTEDYFQYVEFLKQIREFGYTKAGNRICILKEGSRFDKGFEKLFVKDIKSIREFRDRLWWDIENHVMFTFNKVAINLLPNALQNSFAFMDKQKENDQ